MIECILPYHESTLFVKMLQLLAPALGRKGRKDRLYKPWQWLVPIAKSGAVLTRELIVQRCTKDFALLSLICHLGTAAVPAAARGSSQQGQTALFAAVAVESLRATKGANSEMAELVQKSLLKGLVSKAPDQLRVASTMVRGRCPIRG